MHIGARHERTEHNFEWFCTRNFFITSCEIVSAQRYDALGEIRIGTQVWSVSKLGVPQMAQRKKGKWRG
jgi:hypothetical protein